MTPFLIILGGFLLAPMIAGLMASVLCSLQILRDKRPSWSAGILSLLFGILSVWLLMFRSDVLHPGRWPNRFPGHWGQLAAALVASLFLTAVVILIAVTLFQERFRKHFSVSERRALRRLRRQRSWRRVRWFHLLGSSALIVGLTGGLLCLCAARAPSTDHNAVANFAAASHWDTRNPTATPLQSRPETPKPLLEITTAAAFLSPVCLLGLVAAGGWLAFTISFWRGYLRVRPRHRSDLLVRPRS